MEIREPGCSAEKPQLNMLFALSVRRETARCVLLKHSYRFRFALVASVFLIPLVGAAKPHLDSLNAACASAFEKQDWHTASAKCTEGAKAGSDYCAHIFARMVYFGYGEPPDKARAIRMFTILSDLREPNSQLAMAEIYLEGSDVPRDPARAESLALAVSHNPTISTAGKVAAEKVLSAVQSERTAAEQRRMWSLVSVLYIAILLVTALTIRMCRHLSRSIGRTDYALSMALYFAICVLAILLTADAPQQIRSSLFALNWLASIAIVIPLSVMRINDSRMSHATAYWFLVPLANIVLVAVLLFAPTYTGRVTVTIGLGSTPNQ